jgi:uncharacterized protein YcbK (DUF882 family)
MFALIVLLATVQGASVQTPQKTQPQLSLGRFGLQPQGRQARVRTPLKRATATKAPPRHKPSWPAVELQAVNLHESLRFRAYDGDGKLRKNADKELTRFLRCWHTGKQHRVDPRLGRVLYQLARHFGRRVEIYSGYRPRAFCTREHSRHLTASAIDFHISGVRNETVIAWLRANFHPVGVGYYPNGVHVHLDVDRAHDTYWVDAGDAPGPAPARPVVEIGDTAPGQVEATADEPVEAPPPAEPMADEPPDVDPGIPE